MIQIMIWRNIFDQAAESGTLVQGLGVAGWMAAGEVGAIGPGVLARHGCRRGGRSPDQSHPPPTRARQGSQKHRGEAN